MIRFVYYFFGLLPGILAALVPLFLVGAKLAEEKFTEDQLTWHRKNVSPKRQLLAVFISQPIVFAIFLWTAWGDLGYFSDYINDPIGNLETISKLTGCVLLVLSIFLPQLLMEPSTYRRIDNFVWFFSMCFSGLGFELAFFFLFFGFIAPEGATLLVVIIVMYPSFVFGAAALQFTFYLCLYRTSKWTSYYQWEANEREVSSRNAELYRHEREKLQNEKRQNEEQREQVQFMQLQEKGLVRADRLLDLRLLACLERLLGKVDWSHLEHLPRYARWVDTPAEVALLKVELSHKFQLQTIPELYTSEDAAHDAQILYSPRLPLFVPDPTGDVAAELHDQFEDLSFLKGVLQMASAALKQRQIIGAGNHSEEEIKVLFRGLFEMDRDKAERFLGEVEESLARLERKRSSAEARREDVRKRRKMARPAIMDALQELCAMHGEFMPHDQLVAQVNAWLEQQCGNEIEPNVCIAPFERAAIVFHALRLLNELEDRASPNTVLLIRERLSPNRPVKELLKLLDEVKSLAASLSTGVSVEEQIRKLHEYRADTHREFDRTIVDDIQREMAKERFDNTEYLPELTKLMKIKAGL